METRRQFDGTEGYDIKDPATGLNYGYESQNLFASYSRRSMRLLLAQHLFVGLMNYD